MEPGGTGEGLGRCMTMSTGDDPSLFGDPKGYVLRAKKLLGSLRP